MENDILFKVRMADRSSVKFILKDKKLYGIVYKRADGTYGLMETR